MTKHRQAHQTVADAGPAKPKPRTTAAIASADNDHNGKSASDDDIRLCAYQKWEAAGKPTGDGVQFWLEAEHELLDGKSEKSVQGGGWNGYRAHDGLEAEKNLKDGPGSPDGHYRDNNRMFQSDGKRGQRHGSKAE